MTRTRPVSSTLPWSQPAGALSAQGGQRHQISYNFRHFSDIYYYITGTGMLQPTRLKLKCKDFYFSIQICLFFRLVYLGVKSGSRYL